MRQNLNLKQRAYQNQNDLRLLGSFIRKIYAKAPFWNSWSFALYDIWSQRKIGDEKVHGITEWHADIRFWETDTREILGAAVFRDTDFVKIVTDPEYRGLEVEMVTWVEKRFKEKTLTGKTLTIETIECNPVLELLLTSRNYSKDPGHYIYRSKSLETQQEEPVHLPAGFRIKHIETPSELSQFHQAVHAVFNFMDHVDVYKILREAQSFWPELDLIVLTENDEVASFASVWYDKGLSLAEFEPVGTVNGYRKMGLGKAVVAEACNRLRGLGCRKISVMSWHDSQAANALYQQAGLEPKMKKNYWNWNE